MDRLVGKHEHERARRRSRAFGTDGVLGCWFKDAKENRVDPDAGREAEHAGCVTWDNKNILMKGDFLFKVDAPPPATEQRRPLLTRIFDRLPFHPARRET